MSRLRLSLILALALGQVAIAHAQDNYALLFIGNSHSSANDLPGLVTRLILAGKPGVSARSELAPGWGFLSERLDDGVTQASLTSQSWTHVILQAQKYSSTGLFFYPTDAAEEWIRRVKEQAAIPIMFPEWPRRGNTEEGLRVHQLHLGIAARAPACVAPVGLAWEASIAQYPALELHAPDGNHSNRAGALLTAYVFYEVITGQAASALPTIIGVGVGPENQRKLREAASETISTQQAGCQGKDTATASASQGLSDDASAIPGLNLWSSLGLMLLVSVGTLVMGKRM